MYGDCRFRPTLAVTIVLALFRSVAAHPNFFFVNSYCTADAHPTSRLSGHGAPKDDPSITFLLGWAATNADDAPNGEEMNPDRVISQVRDTARVTYSFSVPLAYFRKHPHLSKWRVAEQLNNFKDEVK